MLWNIFLREDCRLDATKGMARGKNPWQWRSLKILLLGRSWGMSMPTSIPKESALRSSSWSSTHTQSCHAQLQLVPSLLWVSTLEKLLQDLRRLIYYCSKDWPYFWQKTVFQRPETRHMNYFDMEEKKNFLPLLSWKAEECVRLAYSKVQKLYVF